MAGSEGREDVSPVNHRAMRGPNGIWNEIELPVLEWEAAAYRVVVPAHLQDSLGLKSPVLRWADIKYREVIAKHGRDIAVIHDLSRHLVNWAYHGDERGPYAGNQRVLFQDEDGRWYALSVGPDRQGSENVVTLVGGSDKRFLRNRLRGMDNVVEREK